MHIESHLALGWGLANLFPGFTRRQRLLITVSGIFSDIDALSYLAGEAAYGNWHHTLGHNVFTAAFVLVLATALAGTRRPMLILVTQLGFWSHLVGDYFMSGWTVEVFWPISRAGFMFRPAIRLDHPANVILAYLSWALLFASWWIWRRSPLEFIWPRFDNLIARALHPGTLCCDICGQPMSLRRGRVLRGLRLSCQNCAHQKATVSSRSD